MDKVVKREVVLKIPNKKNDITPGANYMDRKRCYSIYFFDYKECPECTKYKECLKQYQKDSEKSAKRNTRVGKGSHPSAEPTRAVEKQAETDSRDSFWHSYPIERMSFIQREHFKAVMRKEVRKLK